MVFPFQDKVEMREQKRRKKKKDGNGKGGQAGAGTSFCRSARGDLRLF